MISASLPAPRARDGGRGGLAARLVRPLGVNCFDVVGAADRGLAGRLLGGGLRPLADPLLVGGLPVPGTRTAGRRLAYTGGESNSAQPTANSRVILMGGD